MHALYFNKRKEYNKSAIYALKEYAIYALYALLLIKEKEDKCYIRKRTKRNYPTALLTPPPLTLPALPIVPLVRTAPLKLRPITLALPINAHNKRPI